MPPVVDQTKRRAFIAYCRVSTREQGSSGLGLAAQWEAIQRFAGDLGWTCLGKYEEVASGADNNRPVLMAAVQLAKDVGAVLLVSKVCRVSRRLSYVSALVESADVELVSVDLGLSCSSFELNLMALVAERERQMTSIRTKEALAVLKAKGVKLGSPCPEAWAAQGREAISKKTDVFALDLVPVLEDIINVGKCYTQRDIAAALNARGVFTRRGGAWYSSGVGRLLKRLTALGQPVSVPFPGTR